MQDMIVGKLRQIPGVKLAEPEGAFYVLPEMSNFFGPGRSKTRGISGWCPIPLKMSNFFGPGRR
jgi:aspartate/methionine/tyrosine aminotransferase